MSVDFPLPVLDMIVFTLCSNNYLAKARILGESLLQHNPTTRFVIGLVDQMSSEVDYTSLADFEILPLEQIGIPELEGMVLRYDLVDLNTAVKPFYFQYLFQRHASEENLIISYFDPDISIYSTLEPIAEALTRADVLLTPHVLSPVPEDGKHPREQSFLAFGLYNLGFCAMRRSETAARLLDWWSGHLVEDCRYDPRNGLFVDQAWMDLAPVLFEEVKASRHLGLNMAYWNLHERSLERRDGAWRINGEWPLVFFHFSDLAVDGSGAITKTPSRFTLADRPDLRPLFQEYYEKLVAFGFSRSRHIPCIYVTRRKETERQERQAYFRKHPLRLMLSHVKRCVPKWLKGLVRAA